MEFQFYTVSDVAEILRLNPDRVYEAVRLGLLPAVHIGRQIRIEQEAFEAWVRGGGTSYQEVRAVGACR